MSYFVCVSQSKTWDFACPPLLPSLGTRTRIWTQPSPRAKPNPARDHFLPARPPLAYLYSVLYWNRTPAGLCRNLQQIGPLECIWLGASTQPIPLQLAGPRGAPPGISTVWPICTEQVLFRILSPGLKAASAWASVATLQSSQGLCLENLHLESHSAIPWWQKHPSNHACKFHNGLTTWGRHVSQQLRGV